MCSSHQDPKDDAAARYPEQPIPAADIAGASPPGIEVGACALQPEAAAVSSVVIDLARNLETRGCPVCDHLHRVTFDFLSHWQYALSSDEKVQVEFAAELGFCPAHAWQLEAVSSVAGSSIGYLRLVEHIARKLAHAARSPNGKSEVFGLLRGNRRCRVCHLLREAEQRYIGCLAIFIAEPDGREVYNRNEGLCLRHLAPLVAASKDAETAAYLLERAACRFGEVAANLNAFAEKNAAGDRALCNNDEKDAYWRAIIHIASAKGVAVPLQEE